MKYKIISYCIMGCLCFTVTMQANNYNFLKKLSFLFNYQTEPNIAAYPTQPTVASNQEAAHAALLIDNEPRLQQVDRKLYRLEKSNRYWKERHADTLQRQDRLSWINNLLREERDSSKAQLQELSDKPTKKAEELEKDKARLAQLIHEHSAIIKKYEKVDYEVKREGIILLCIESTGLVVGQMILYGTAYVAHRVLSKKQ